MQGALALVDDLYAGVAEPERFGRFLERSAAVLGCHVVGLTVRNDARGTGAAIRMGGPGADEQQAQRYEHHYRDTQDNLWYLRARRTAATGTVIRSCDWATPAEVRRTRYYDEFLRVIDVEHSVAVCAHVAPERAVVLSYGRSARRGPVDEPALQLVRLLAPHVVNAHALTAQRSQQMAQVAPRPLTTFLLDRDLRWKHADPEAAALVERGWLRARVGCAIEPVNSASKAAWWAHCRETQRTGSLRGPPVPLFDSIGSLVGLMALRQVGVDAPTGQARYACMVRSLSMGSHRDLERTLGVVFGLTPAEARLVVDMKETRELAASAQRLGLSVKSSRTRLQSVFEKTGTNRQSALYGLLDAMDDIL